MSKHKSAAVTGAGTRSASQRTSGRSQESTSALLLQQDPSHAIIGRALLIGSDAMRERYGPCLRLLVSDFEHSDDGRIGLAIALARPPVVIVMAELDVRFIDAHTLCALLKDDAATRQVPIVVITADQSAALELARLAIATAVVVTPCTPEMLLEQVRQAIGARSADQELQPAAPMPCSSTGQFAARAERPRTERRLARSHIRGETRTPPVPPPHLICPLCDASLHHVKSHVGGVSVRFAEQWDYYACVTCGTYQYRHRTKLLRQVAAMPPP